MSIHFTLAELTRSRKAQELGISNDPPASLAANLAFTMAGLERLRAFLDHAIIVSSGYRCPALNEAVGGALDSQHLVGQAADFTCPGFGDPAAIVKALMPMLRILGIDQVIYEGTWVHVSFTLTPRYHALRALPGGHYELIV